MVELGVGSHLHPTSMLAVCCYTTKLGLSVQGSGNNRCRVCQGASRWLLVFLYCGLLLVVAQKGAVLTI